MRAYRAAIIATILGLVAVAILVLTVELSGDDDAAVVDAPTISATSSPGTVTPQPTPDLELMPYYQDLDTAFQRASDESIVASNALEQGLNDAQDVEQIKAAYTDFLTTTEAVFQAAIDTIGAFTVPEAVQEGHAAFLAASQSSKDLATQLKADIAAVTTEDELFELLDNFGRDKGPLLDDADNACVLLQETAESHGIFLDLACPQ